MSSKSFIEKVKLAFQSFIKAFKNPDDATRFLSNEQPKLDSNDQSHLRLLAMLQNSGRLIDFLKEDISGFSDAQVGGAVRKIHEECNKTLEELVTIRPVLEDSEGASIQVPAGYDPVNLKVVGKVKGTPPFTGILVHKGWKAHKRSLPKKIGEQHNEVICPAEVEIR